MTVEFPALALILLFPLIGVVFNMFFGSRSGRGAVNVVGPGVMFAAFAVATWAFLTLLKLPPGGALAAPLWGWIEGGPFHVEFGLRVDALSGVMVMIVTGVGSLIFLYSVGYMAHDEDFARFFTYMNLFALSMLILILADNLLMMFVGWEGVGLCSYLLIAFWYTDPQFAYNGRKAFVVNRIGDAGFLLAIFTTAATLGAHGVWTLNFVELHNNAALLGASRRDRDLRPALHRRDRQVRANSALRLAARRDGRPHSGQRADPRGDDGHRGRVHDRAARLPLHDGSQCARSGCHSWRGHRDCLPRPSRSSSQTSRKFSPIRPSASLATCFSASARARSRRASSTS